MLSNWQSSSMILHLICQSSAAWYLWGRFRESRRYHHTSACNVDHLTWEGRKLYRVLRAIELLFCTISPEVSEVRASLLQSPQHFPHLSIKSLWALDWQHGTEISSNCLYLGNAFWYGLGCLRFLHSRMIPLSTKGHCLH